MTKERDNASSSSSIFAAVFASLKSTSSPDKSLDALAALAMDKGERTKYVGNDDDPTNVCKKGSSNCI